MTVTCSILYDRIRWEEKALAKKAEDLGLSTSLVDAKRLALDFAVDADSIATIYGNTVLQRCISHVRGLYLSAYLESKGLHVVNEYGVASICGNKLLTTLALKKAKVPTPRTFVAFSPQAALGSAESLGYPVVLKPLVGSWGRMVAVAKDSETARALIELKTEHSDLYNNVHYIQELVSRPPRDIRCVVVGGEIIASVYRNAPPGEWRTNVARGGISTICRLSAEEAETILKAAGAVGGGVLGVDAMESKDGIVVHEVNATVEFKGAASCTDRDIPEAIIQYVREIARR